MPEQEVENLEEQEELKARKEEELKRTLEEISTKVDERAKLSELLADPAIREVLSAREAGLDIDIKAKKRGTIPEEPEEEKDPDFDSMDNRALVQYLARKVFPKALRGVLAPVMAELDSLKSYRSSQETVSLTKQVEEVRKEYPDFNDYREDILSLSRDNPGLSVRELYLIARTRKGGGITVNTASERPTGAGGRPVKGKEAPMEPGKKGFEARLSQVLDRLDVSGIEKE